jgi:uncharacterized OsmC-like protein
MDGIGSVAGEEVDMTGIRQSIENAVGYLSEHPDEARYTDSFARANLGDSLSVTVVGPGGEHITTDMPAGIGGRGDSPSPGWLFRAAIASCVAATIGMEAAREGITLDSLEVEVDGDSDDRGILGMDASIPPGPLSVRIRIRAGAAAVDPGRLRQVVEAGASRCPVSDATQRAVSVTTEIKIA